MIKSKIDARERALEIVASLGLHDRELIMDMAKEFTDFLVGDAELPEVTDDNAHIKELLEIANKSFDNSRKCNNDEISCMFKGGNTDVSSEIPCKSDVE